MEKTPEEIAEQERLAAIAKVLAGNFAALTALSNSDTVYPLRILTNAWLSQNEMLGIDCNLL